MKKTVFSIIIVFLFLFSVLMLNTVSSDTIEVSSSGVTWYVDNDGTADYTSIQAAIDNASSGDTVFVYNGTYYENVIIETGNISLIGENKETTIIDGNGNGKCIDIEANGIVIKNFTLKNAITGIAISTDSKQIHISKNFILNNNYGILVLSSIDVTIDNNNITNCKDDGIYISGSVCLVKNNFIKYNINGVNLRSGSNIIENNIFSSNNVGLRIEWMTSEKPYNSIESNLFKDNMFGIKTTYPNQWQSNCYNEIHENNFMNDINIRYYYNNKNANWNNNYWDDCDGNFYFIRGIPFLVFLEARTFIFGFNIDSNPASEPFDI